MMKGWVPGTLRTAGLVLSRRDVTELLGWGGGKGVAQGDPSHHSHPPPVFLPRRGTSPGCLQALFRLGTYPGSFNPQPDGKSRWHCWRREGPRSFVPLVEHTSQQVPGWGGSLAVSTGQPLSHLDVRWPKDSVADLPAGGDSHHKQGLLQGGNSRGSPRRAGHREDGGGVVWLGSTWETQRKK